MRFLRRSLKSELKKLDRKIQLATDRFVATHLIRAGQICAGGGDTSGALQYYGRAVDAYLSIGHGREAEILCRKIIALKPDVVRARCTLALILLGRGDVVRAAEQVREYVAAARAADQVDLAVRNLRLMAELTHDERLRDSLLSQCRDLGVVIAAEEPVPPGVDSKPVGADAGRWMSAIRLAMSTPEEVDEMSVVDSN